MLRIRGRVVTVAFASAAVFTAALANAATFTVTNTLDIGAGSLRDTVAAAIAAGSSNTVTFAPLVTGTITLTSGQIRIDGPLTITGPGRDVLAIDGNLNGRIFTVIENNAPACPALTGPSDFLVTIAGLTLKNASRNTANSAGGAIQSSKSLSLDSVTIRDSSAKAGGGVGFFLQHPGQTLTITHSQFLDNFARPTVSGNSGIHLGAGLAVQENCSGSPQGPTIPSTVTITNSLFIGNRTQPVDLWGLGGAITTLSYADITISDTRIVGNRVDIPNPPVSGALYFGGGVYGRAKSLTIVGSEISDNAADRGGGLRLFNDVLALQGSESAMAVQIVNSTVSGNVVTATAGALEVYGNVALEIDNSTIAGNAAPADHTSGILLTTGATNPASGANATAPTLKLVSSILANNPSLGGDVATNAPLMPGFVIDASHSLIQKICPDSACTASVADSDNLLAIDPLLGPLTLNGGTSRTQALLAGSPAIDTGSNPLNLSADQRGTLRPQGGAPDIGAFELADSTPPTILCGASDGAWHSGDISIACTASDPESGLDTVADSAFGLTTSTSTGTETANAATGSRLVCNTLGDCANAGPIAGNKVDKKAPTIAITSPTLNATYQLNASVGASYACTDGGSGVASCQGPVATGGAIDTSSTGTKTFTVDAVDKVGNSSPLAVTYSVIKGGGGGSTSADVAISLSVPNKVSRGGTLMYSMTITNNSGKTAANGVVVSDTLPAGTVFVSASASQGAVTAPTAGSNGTVMVNIGSLTGGAKATVNVIVTATAASGTLLTNTATVSATTQDLNGANNAATKSTTVSKK